MYDVVKNRKVKYGELLNERAPLLETINQAIGANSVDYINLNRLIDFQINCGILCTKNGDYSSGTNGRVEDTLSLEHSPIRTRAPRGFCILRDQVLVLYSRQELDPLAVDRNMVLLPIWIFIK